MLLRARWATCILIASLAARAESAPRPLYLAPAKLQAADRDLEELLRAALGATGKVRLVGRRDQAELLGRLTVAHRKGTTVLDVEVLTAKGALVARPHEVVGPEDSPIDAAERIAAVIAAAASGEAPAAPLVAEPGGPSGGEARRAAPDDLRRAAPAETRRETTAEPRDWRSPYDSSSRRLDFLLGVELAEGPWSADPATIAAGSDSGFDLSHYAPAFTRTIDGRWHPGLSLHGGFTFLGAASFELAWTASRWADSGSATLIGARMAGYPFPALWPARWFDLGLEAGLGYARLSGSSYTMTGGYWSLGVTAELPLNRWMGVAVAYRRSAPFLKHFYIDYDRQLNEPTSGVGFSWNTLTAGLNFHPGLDL